MNNELLAGSNIKKETQRDYLFDNARAVLIILMVFGHLLTDMLSKSELIKSVYVFVFFFHMPAMAFISGYFSKNIKKGRETAFETFLLPYLILNVIEYLYKIFILKEAFFGFRAFRPYWGLWYLFALFIWKFFLPDLIRIRFLLPASFLLGILSGFSKEFSSYMALGRVIGFFPFFILGYYISKEHIEKIKKIPKIFSVGIFILVGVFSNYAVKHKLFKMETLYLRKAYKEDIEIKSMIYRTLVYIIAVLMMFALLNLISNRKSFLTKIGMSTMTIYILHLFTIPLLEKYHILKDKPNLYLVYAIIMTVIIVFVYSRAFVKKIYDFIMNKLVSMVIKKQS